MLIEQRLDAHPTPLVRKFAWGIVLLLTTVFAELGDSGRSLDEDIKRLLVESDFSLRQNEAILHNQTRFNQTTVVRENITGYWHLPADAPVVDMSPVDAQSRVPLMQKPKIDDPNPNANEDMFPSISVHCSRLLLVQTKRNFGLLANAVISLSVLILNIVWILRLICLRGRCLKLTGGGGGWTDSRSAIFLSWHTHSCLCAVLFFFVLAGTNFASFWATNCALAHICVTSSLALDIIFSAFWCLQLLSLLFLQLFTRQRTQRLTDALKPFKVAKRNLVTALMCHMVPWIVCAFVKLVYNFSAGKFTNSDISASDCNDPTKRLPITSIVDAVLTILPIPLVLAFCLAYVFGAPGRRRRKVANPNDENYYHDHLLKPADFSSSFSSPLNGHQGDPTNIPSPEKSGARTFTGVVLIHFSSVPASLILIFGGLLGLAVCGLRIYLTWLLSAPTERFELFARISNAAEILAIGTFYPFCALCFCAPAGRRHGSSLLNTREIEYSLPRYACEEGDCVPQISVEGQASSRFRRTEKTISPRELLEIPKYTRRQFYSIPQVDPKQLEANELCKIEFKHSEKQNGETEYTQPP